MWFCVVNFAVGVEHVLSGGTKVYAGFHTHFSAASMDSQSDVSLAVWDLYHVSAGATFRAFNQAFTLGANVGLGSELVDKQAESPSALIGLPDSADVSVQQITVLLRHGRQPRDCVGTQRNTLPNVSSDLGEHHVRNRRIAGQSTHNFP